jgi:hypothetical protein
MSYIVHKAHLLNAYHTTRSLVPTWYIMYALCFDQLELTLHFILINLAWFLLSSLWWCLESKYECSLNLLLQDMLAIRSALAWPYLASHLACLGHHLIFLIISIISIRINDPDVKYSTVLQALPMNKRFTCKLHMGESPTHGESCLKSRSLPLDTRILALKIASNYPALSTTTPTSSPTSPRRCLIQVDGCNLSYWLFT